MNRYVASADIGIVRRAIASCSRPLMSRLLPWERGVIKGYSNRLFRNFSKVALAFWDVVARDGIQRHYIGLRLPLTGVRLDPRMDLAA
jgi:hypothetical protein